MERTEQHPITLPLILLHQWQDEARRVKTSEAHYVGRNAAQWGADQELEACEKWLEDQLCMPKPARDDVISKLRAARRPKPPSLKERALSETAAAVAGGNITPERGAIIRLALKALPND